MIKPNYNDYTKGNGPDFEENAKGFVNIIRIIFSLTILYFALRIIISLNGCG